MGIIDKSKKGMSMKNSGKLIQYLSKHIDKIIIIASYIILLLFLLTLTPGILYEERLIKEGQWQEYREIGNDWFKVTYALNTGANKPLISTNNGNELISVNGFKSSIQIDNDENRSFWNHEFRNVVEGDTVVRHNMVWDNYQLMQRTTLSENTTVIDYRITTYDGEDNFDLTLNLWHEYQASSLLKIDNAYVNDNYQEENQENIQPKPTHVVLMQTDPQPDNIENTPYWANLTYSFENLTVETTWENLVETRISYASWEEKSETEESSS